MSGEQPLAHDEAQTLRALALLLTDETETSGRRVKMALRVVENRLAGGAPPTPDEERAPAPAEGSATPTDEVWGLFEEARHAVNHITLAQAAVHGIDPTLPQRMLGVQT